MPEQLWFTELLNRLFGRPVAGLMESFHIHMKYPEAPIANSVAMEVLVCLFLIAVFLVVRARLSVDNPGGGSSNLFPLPVTTQDRVFKNPEAWAWNATVQREVGFQTTVEVAYVGRRGLHGQQELDLNAVPAGTTLANPDAVRICLAGSSVWPLTSGTGRLLGPSPTTMVISLVTADV